tara:strand:- start:44 stop:1597 length:1554 start_codon:yes stop_codon:yes gene_type:complete
LAGVVIDKEGRPVPDVVVLLVELSSRERKRTKARSDAEGEFSFRVPPGDYWLQVELRGYLPVSRIAIVPALGREVVKLFKGITGRGRVLDSDGRPVVGAKVRACNLKATTDSDGRCEFEGLPAGTFEVSAYARGLKQGSVRVASTGEFGCEFELTLERAWWVQGRVWDSAGEPALGALVRRFRGGKFEDLVKTDDEGRFSIGPLESGKVRLMAECGSEVGALDAVLAEGSRPLELRLRPAAELSGLVTGPGNRPLVGASVQVRNVAALSVLRQAKTDAAGRYQVGRLYPGLYRVRVVPAGTRQIFLEPPRHRLEVEVEVGQDSLQRDLSVPAGCTIAVVVAGPDGAPLAGAGLRVVREGEDFNDEVQTDPRGRAELTGLAPGLYEVRVLKRWPEERAPLLAHARVRVTAGIRRELDLVARGGAGIRGRLIRGDGRPVPGIGIVVQSPDGSIHKVSSTRADGAFSFGGLLPGDYVLTVIEGELFFLAAKRGWGSLETEPKRVSLAEGRSLDLEDWVVP